MKASGQNASYLSVLAIPPRRRYRGRAGQVLALRRQRGSRFRRQIRQDPPSHVALPFRMLVVHIVASFAIVPIANVASREDVLSAAEGALARVRCRGLDRLRSGRKFDDLVVRVTTVPRERRRWDLRRGRWSSVMLFRFLLLLRLLPEQS